MLSPKRKVSGAAKNLEGMVDKQSQMEAFVQPVASGLTTNEGLSIADNHNSLKAGVRGPLLAEDFIAREKIASFGLERIPERAVYARGSAAHGYFKVYKPMVQFTRAGFLQDPELETPVFVRFSNATGSQGAADTVRDMRGFAVKFYTAEGNYDLVGSSMPVFFIQDAIKFPDLIHALKPEPNHGMPQASSAHDTFWDFASLMPETTHMLMWLMSDRALPRSFRMMEGFGVHTFRLISARGDAHYVKFHWKPKLGAHALMWDEAQKLAGRDPDFYRRDLWEAIESGNFPEWELGMQIVNESRAADLGFDILDATKLIPESMVPVQPVGKLVLNRNPDNFFAETEQVAFHPGHLVPGIDFSNDPLLQGRLLSYSETQRTRLGGANFHEIPINRSLCPVQNFQRDGINRQAVHRGRVAYEPNTLAGGAEFRAEGAAYGFQSIDEEVSGPKARRRSPSFDDHFSQATLFWDSQSTPEKDHIVAAFRYELSRVEPSEIRQRVVDNLAHVDSRLAARVATSLGVTTPDSKAAAGRIGFRDHRIASKVDEDPALSLAGRPPASIKTRKVAVLVADGIDYLSVRRVIQDLTEAGVTCKLVSTQLGAVATASGRQLPVDCTLTTTPSVMFDAVVVPGGSDCNATLAACGDAVHFVLEAYKHGKTICAINEGAQLLATLGFAIGKNLDVTTSPTPGVLLADARRSVEGELSKEVMSAMALHRHWERANTQAIPA
jgi:catalase